DGPPEFIQRFNCRRKVDPAKSEWFFPEAGYCREQVVIPALGTWVQAHVSEGPEPPDEEIAGGGGRHHPRQPGQGGKGPVGRRGRAVVAAAVCVRVKAPQPGGIDGRRPAEDRLRLSGRSVLAQRLFVLDHEPSFERTAGTRPAVDILPACFIRSR